MNQVAGWKMRGNDDGMVVCVCEHTAMTSGKVRRVDLVQAVVSRP